MLPGVSGVPPAGGGPNLFFQIFKKNHNTYHDVGPLVEVGSGEGVAYLTCCRGCLGCPRLEGVEGEGVDPWSPGYSCLCRDVGGSESDSLLLENQIIENFIEGRRKISNTYLFYLIVLRKKINKIMV